MIQVYSPGNTDYTQNGNMVLFPTEAIVHPVMNSVWEVSLNHPIDEEGRWKYIIEDAIIKMPSFNGEQLFRIVKKEKSDSGVDAMLQPVFMDAKKDCFLVDVRPTDKTGQEALNIMLAPNAKYSAQSNITKKSTAYYEAENFIEALNSEADNSFINRWGGEICFDNFKIIVNKQIGADRDVQVLYGKNIKQNGFSEEVDLKDVITRIVPKSFNGHMISGSSPWVDSPLINTYQNISYGVIVFDNIKMIEDAQEDDEANGVTICKTQAELNAALKNKCNEQFAGGIDKPKVTITVDMEMLKNTDMYSDVQALENVSFGDTVHCKHSKLSIVTDARVIDMVWDCIKDEVETVTLGDFQYNFFRDASSAVNRVESAIRPDGSVIAGQVQGIIDGVAAQMRVQSSIAKKSNVRAVLFEDLDPNSETFGALCIGPMGFQIAGSRTADDRDWKWTTFGTGQGFFADFVVFGSMLCDRIRGGLLQLGGLSGKGGALSILDKDGAEIGRWDMDGINVKKGDIRGTTITLGGQNNIDGLLKLLDALGNEIIRLDKDGVYAKGKYVSEGTARKVEISEGAFKVLTKEGTLIGMLQATGDNWMRLEISGGAAIRFNRNELYLDADKIGPGGYTGKSGRAVFSDGTYMDFQKGFCTGGNTKEGSF